MAETRNPEHFWLEPEQRDAIRERLQHAGQTFDWHTVGDLLHDLELALRRWHEHMAATHEREQHRRENRRDTGGGWMPTVD